MDIWLYEGAYYGTLSVPGVMRMQEHFKAKSSDILIASFPKSGFTWLKALVFAIVNRTCYKGETHPLLTKISHDLIPVLEINIYGDHSGSTSRQAHISEPRLLSTHVHYTSLPKSVTNCACKIVYICRDPKDVFVSFLHFAPKLLPQTLSKEEANNVMLSDKLLNNYNMFCQGLCPYGPYWDHVLGYWKASIKNPQEVLFLKYEDIKKEPQLQVKKIAEFLGQPFSLQEEEKGEVQHVVDLCSFESLSNLEVNQTGVFEGIFKYDAFYRKGEVGDWKYHMTDDMADRLDEITKQKFHGYDLTF